MRGRTIALAAALAVLVGAGAGVLYAIRSDGDKASESAPASSELARFARGPLTALQTPAETPATPDYVFRDREGRPVRFADFRGRIVVVNLWAMWCAPCRTEMPTLAALQGLYDPAELLVLPVNVDRTEREIADAASFIDVHEPLPLYSDPQFQLPFEFPGRGGMPQTIVLDRQGRIRAWFTGEADWASPEARALFDALLTEPAAS